VPGMSPWMIGDPPYHVAYPVPEFVSNQHSSEKLSWTVRGTSAPDWLYRWKYMPAPVGPPTARSGPVSAYPLFAAPPMSAASVVPVVSLSGQYPAGESADTEEW
jgi:hypothetical protein